MSYLVLARKLRPQTFDEVVGQRAVVKTLRNALVSGRIHHAFLFCGPRGTGKTTTARILAKALNCEQGPTPDPCNKCHSCREITAGTSVDVLEIDGASNTGVDDVRQLRENARYLPVSSRRKIYIIDEVHMLSVSAFNALLKTLEEPPEHVTFIFATTEPQKIPVTILSRCQRHDLGRVGVEDLTKMLSSRLPGEGVQIDGPGLSLVAQAADGSVRDALSLVDQVVSFSGEGEISASEVREALGFSDRETLLSLSEAILARDGEAALGVVDGVFGQGQDLVHFARGFLGHLRDLTVAAMVRDPGGLIKATPEDLGRLVEQTAQASPLWLQQLFDRFAVTAERVARSDTPRLVLEMGVIALLQAEPLEPLGDLLERLESLETAGTGRPRGPRGGGATPPRGRAPRGASEVGRAPRGASEVGRAPRGASEVGRAAETSRAAGPKRDPGEATQADGGSRAVRASRAGSEDHAAETGSAEASSRPGEGTRVRPGRGGLSLSEDPLAAWEQIVGACERVSKRLSASLYRVQFFGLETRDGILRISGGVEQGSFEQQQLLGDSAVLAELQQHLTKALGRPVELALRVVEDAASSPPALPDTSDPQVTRAAPPSSRAPDAEIGRESGAAAAPPRAASPRSLRERDDQWRRERRETRRKEALAHAAVRDALEVLGGQVSEVHVVEE